MSYKILLEYWGKGLLVAALISAIGGLLIGGVDILYYAAVIFFVVSILCISLSKRVRE
ncbi:MAG TPA: hypothetical protein VJY43_07135 [Methanocorpusculum sp.]|nr:hypothetical protein [Methanocorpusculum sp.]